MCRVRISRHIRLNHIMPTIGIGVDRVTIDHSVRETFGDRFQRGVFGQF